MHDDETVDEPISLDEVRLRRHGEQPDRLRRIEADVAETKAGVQQILDAFAAEPHPAAPDADVRDIAAAAWARLQPEIAAATAEVEGVTADRHDRFVEEAVLRTAELGRAQVAAVAEIQALRDKCVADIHAAYDDVATETGGIADQVVDHDDLSGRPCIADHHVPVAPAPEFSWWTIATIASKVAVGGLAVFGGYHLLRSIVRSPRRGLRREHERGCAEPPKMSPAAQFPRSVTAHRGIDYGRIDRMLHKAVRDHARIELHKHEHETQVLNVPVAGPQGPRGPTGAAGLRGRRGKPGLRGPQGRTGTAGARGPAGSRGDAGAKGAPGRRGATGPRGAAGPRGARGPREQASVVAPVVVEVVAKKLLRKKSRRDCLDKVQW